MSHVKFPVVNPETKKPEYQFPKVFAEFESKLPKVQKFNQIVNDPQEKEYVTMLHTNFTLLCFDISETRANSVICIWIQRTKYLWKSIL